LIALAPCRGCGRHVKVSEAACPFCGAVAEGLSVTPGTTRRLGRAAAFAFTTTLGAAQAAGCAGFTDGSSIDKPATVDSGADTGGVQALYGAVYVDAGQDAAKDSGSGSADAATDAGVDSGPADSGADAKEGGGIVPLYGAPAYGLPAPDAGK
jgi:hypothetical protein